jgi:hypothetical protein
MRAQRMLATVLAYRRRQPRAAGPPPHCGEALHRVADGIEARCEIEALCEQAEPTHHDARLVSASGGAILDQLPAGAVEELAVCPPFHDPGAVALRHLAVRLQPRRLLVGYQPDLPSSTARPSPARRGNGAPRFAWTASPVTGMAS